MDSENKSQRTNKTADNTLHLSALIDRGNFDTDVSGVTARNGVSCCSLSNGDIVVCNQEPLDDSPRLGHRQNAEAWIFISVDPEGLTYIPEHALKINATSSISTRII
ncbi:hypothetical protein NC651_021226 [Populus alba x Populus x berolinensis]|nr:hypothetical protein NC651_021226 [Populus alba x Populus x berolinensis]